MRYRLAALLTTASLGATGIAPADPLRVALPDPCSGSGVSIDDFMVWDGAGTADVPVRADQACQYDREITFQTYDLTAKDGEDYVGKSGTLLLPAGSTVAKIQVLIIRSVQPEPPEKFGIQLLDGATFTDPDGEVTIYYQQN
ncbi:MAG TPA: Calx-beta domain-containing protein [Micromonosporaceae bacterium]|jgi:hypothetical protein|nr:Calx-beta domain-containing protein [Micromonosporaceae bacterium]